MFFLIFWWLITKICQILNHCIVTDCVRNVLLEKLILSIRKNLYFKKKVTKNNIHRQIPKKNASQDSLVKFPKRIYPSPDPPKLSLDSGNSEPQCSVLNPLLDLEDLRCPAHSHLAPDPAVRGWAHRECLHNSVFPRHSPSLMRNSLRVRPEFHYKGTNSLGIQAWSILHRILL